MEPDEMDELTYYDVTYYDVTRHGPGHISTEEQINAAWKWIEEEGPPSDEVGYVEDYLEELNIVDCEECNFCRADGAAGCTDCPGHRWERE